MLFRFQGSGVGTFPLANLRSSHTFGFLDELNPSNNKELPLPFPTLISCFHQENQIVDRKGKDEKEDIRFPPTFVTSQRLPVYPPWKKKNSYADVKAFYRSFSQIHCFTKALKGNVEMIAARCECEHCSVSAIEKFRRRLDFQLPGVDSSADVASAGGGVSSSGGSTSSIGNGGGDVSGGQSGGVGLEAELRNLKRWRDDDLIDEDQYDTLRGNLVQKMMKRG